MISEGRNSSMTRGHGDAETRGQPAQKRRSPRPRVAASPRLGGAAVTFCLLLSGFWLGGCRESVALPLLFPVPATTLTTETGQPLNLRELRGKVAIYDFIFTNCAASCPVMAASMRTLTREIDSPDVRFVSISVDPARDTPPVLSRYAAAVRNDDRWIFLTGEREQILDLSIKSFKLAAGEPEPIPGAEAVLHSQRFVVVDREGMIRGYYDGASPDEMKKLARDVRALLRA